MHSVGVWPHAISSRKGRSRAEFIAKLGTAAEEADECVDWLEYLRDAKIATDPTLLQEADELARIMAAAVKTARSNHARINFEVRGQK